MAAATAALRGPCRVHGHRFKKATIELFVLPPPLTHPHCPLPSPCPRSPRPVCVSCDTRSTCPLLLLPLEVVLRVLRVLRVPPMLHLLLPLELPLVCCLFYRVSFLNNLFCDATNISATAVRP